MKISPIILFALSSSAVILAAPTPGNFGLARTASKIFGAKSSGESSAARELTDVERGEGFQGEASSSSSASDRGKGPELAGASSSREVAPPTQPVGPAAGVDGAAHGHGPPGYPQYPPHGQHDPGSYHFGAQAPQHPGGYSHYPQHPQYPQPGVYHQTSPPDMREEFYRMHQADGRFINRHTGWMTWRAAQKDLAKAEEEKAKERHGWFW